jgi:tetratricopeptide (TPR) repeat protein
MLALALLAFGTHVQALTAGFVFDDNVSIQYANSLYRWSQVFKFFTTNHSAYFGNNFYRPVLSIWYELLDWLFGTHAAGWHLASMILHVVCTLLVFRLARKVVGKPAVAWMAAALFAVHPAHVEAVSWASAMGDPLMTTLMLLSVLAFVRWMECGKLKWWVASFAAGTACVFTKETAVVMPVLLLATARAVRPPVRTERSSLIATIPFFVLAAVFLLTRRTVLHGFAHSLSEFSTAEMICTWPAALWFYLRHLLWPTVISPYYPLQYVQTWNCRQFFEPLVWVTTSVCILGYLLWRSTNPRRFWFCVAWIAVPLAPVLYLKAFVQFELVHDRFLYVPLVGFSIAAAVVLGWLAERVQAWMPLRIAPIVMTSLITLAAFGTMNNMLWWQNNVALFRRALAVTPDNPKALINLFDAYVQERRYEEGSALLNQALAANPNNIVASEALFALGRFAWMMGDNQRAEIYLLRSLQLKESLRIAPRYDLWMHLASVELRMKRVEKAEEAAEQSLAINPGGAGAHLTMGSVLLEKGDRMGAASEFRKELHLFPNNLAAQKGLSRALGNEAP